MESARSCCSGSISFVGPKTILAATWLCPRTFAIRLDRSDWRFFVLRPLAATTFYSSQPVDQGADVDYKTAALAKGSRKSSKRANVYVFTYFLDAD